MRTWPPLGVVLVVIALIVGTVLTVRSSDGRDGASVRASNRDVVNPSMRLPLSTIRSAAEQVAHHSKKLASQTADYTSGVTFGAAQLGIANIHVGNADRAARSVTVVQIYGDFNTPAPALNPAYKDIVFKRSAVCIVIDEQTGMVISSSSLRTPVDLRSLGLVHQVDLHRR